MPTGIYGGTLEVFRNMIAQHALGLGRPNYSPRQAEVLDPSDHLRREEFESFVGAPVMGEQHDLAETELLQLV